jgi:hypothetical protein
MSWWRKIKSVADAGVDLGLLVTSFLPGRTGKARRYLRIAGQANDALGEVMPEQSEMPGGVQVDDIPPEVAKFCTDCGTRWSADAKFCGKCGHEL